MKGTLLNSLMTIWIEPDLMKYTRECYDKTYSLVTLIGIFSFSADVVACHKRERLQVWSYMSQELTRAFLERR